MKFNIKNEYNLALNFVSHKFECFSILAHMMSSERYTIDDFDVSDATDEIFERGGAC